MSAAATARQTVTPPSIFARPAIPSSKATIRRKGGGGAMSMKLAWTLAAARRRITDQSRGTIKFAALEKIATVLQPPRCLRCHQLDSPLQGDARRIHVRMSFAARTIIALAPCAAVIATTKWAIRDAPVWARIREK